MAVKLGCWLFILVSQVYTALALPVNESMQATRDNPGNESELIVLQDANFMESVQATIAAEFVFVVAGDHILMPVPEPAEDNELHINAMALAQLIQKLYCSETVYNLINTTSQEVALEIGLKQEDRNPLSLLIERVVERLKEYPEVYVDYLNEQKKLKSRKLVLSQSHGKNMSDQQQLISSEISPEQIKRGEELLQQPKVKALILSVTFLQQSQQQLSGIPPSLTRLREYTVLAKAMYKMAKKPELREQVQKVYNEAAEEYLQKYEVLQDEEDKLFYEKLSQKIDNNEVLKEELEYFKSELHH